MNDNNDFKIVTHKKPKMVLDISNIRQKSHSRVVLKRLLCNEFVIKKHCKHGNKCYYAHDIKEQIIDNDRLYVYEILNKIIANENIDLSHLSYEENMLTYKIFNLLTKMCRDCSVQKCIGGINCKYGAHNPKYVVCYDDLNNGTCTNILCKYIHLSKYGLKIHKKQHIRAHVITQPIITATDSSDINSNSSLESIASDYNELINDQNTAKKIIDYEKLCSEPIFII